MTGHGPLVEVLVPGGPLLRIRQREDADPVLTVDVDGTVTLAAGVDRRGVDAAADMFWSAIAQVARLYDGLPGYDAGRRKAADDLEAFAATERSYIPAPGTTADDGREPLVATVERELMVCTIEACAHIVRHGLVHDHSRC